MGAITNVYTIAAVKLNSTLIDAITAQSIKPGLAALVLGGSGAIDPTFVGIGEIRPEFTFTTTAIKSALAACGISGLALTGGTVFFQKTILGGVRGSTLAHVKGTIVAGIAIPVSLRAAQGGAASIEYRIILTSADGTTAPIAFAASQTLETGQGTVPNAYTLGAVTINGTELVGVQSLSIDFGIGVWVSNGSGLVYPTHSAISSRAPVITIQTLDCDQFVTMGLDGAAQGATNSTIVLGDLTEGAVVGTSPITFTIDEGLFYYEEISGSHGERLGGSVKLIPTFDGTAAIMAISGTT